MGAEAMAATFPTFGSQGWDHIQTSALFRRRFRHHLCAKGSIKRSAELFFMSFFIYFLPGTPLTTVMETACIEGHHQISL